MKIVNMKGGLGNQLFQYSFAKLIMQETNEVTKLDFSNYKTDSDRIRKPRLLRFKISLPLASQDEIHEVCFFDHSKTNKSFISKNKKILEFVFNPRFYFEFSRAYKGTDFLFKNDYFDGYWQSWKYVDSIWDSIRPDLIPSNDLDDSTIKMIKKVSAENSVFVGVRKGDYEANKKHYGEFGISYYRNAMKYISERIENPIFYIFSNDIPWVKHNLDFSGFNHYYREQDEVIDDFEDLFIMASCRHSIIINSTYHWWGARLNEYNGKIIIAPGKWFFDNKPIEIVPPRWVTM